MTSRHLLVVAALLFCAGCGSAPGSAPLPTVPPAQAFTQAPSVPEAPRERPRVTPGEALNMLRDLVAGRSSVPVRWEGEVTMSLQGLVVGVRPGEALSKPSGWRVCPQGATSVGEATCPVSAVVALRNARAQGWPLQVSDAAPDRLRCTRTTPPEVGGGERVVSVRPVDGGCAVDFAVNVVLTPEGRVRLVDLALDGP